MTSRITDYSQLPDRDLIVRLHDSYKEFIKPDNRDPELKQKFHGLYKELLHRLVTPTKSEQIADLLNSKNFPGYNEQSMAGLHEELTKSFSKMHEVLLNVTDNLAQEAMDDYSKLRIEGRNSDVLTYTHFPLETVLTAELKQGTAHKKLVQNNQFAINNPSIDIFCPAVRIYGLSKAKEPLLIEEGKSSLSWQDYKNKTCAAITVFRELGTQSIGDKNILDEILSKNSPALLAFQNAVNSVCEALHLGTPFTTAKKTQELKQVLRNITATVKIDNPLEEEKSDQKSLKI